MLSRENNDLLDSDWPRNSWRTTFTKLLAAGGDFRGDAGRWSADADSSHERRLGIISRRQRSARSHWPTLPSSQHRSILWPDQNGGLRCLYHGWLFDIHGKCLEQPAEPTDKKFCHKVRHVSYPVQEKGGVIWAYMERVSHRSIPNFQFLTAPEPNRIAFRTILKCNWLQALESSTDPAHTTYLHRIAPGTRSIRSGQDVRAVRGVEMPAISIEPTSFGTRIFALHNSPNGRKYLRVNNYVYPCGATPSTSTGEAGYQGRWYVPIDDLSCCAFEFIYRHAEPLDKESLRNFRAANVAADLRHVRRQDNRYLQDRQAQNNGSYSGMGDYFPAQDAFAVETQGAIQDRTREHLGSTDIVIIGIRKILLQAIKQIEAGGEAPGLIRSHSDKPFPDLSVPRASSKTTKTVRAFAAGFLASRRRPWPSSSGRVARRHP